MANTFLGNILEFFVRLGIYDVILPFILVFTIMFAILEKTKIFGTEVIDKHEYPKKNLNSMVAFVIAFLVVASSRLVAIINEAMANLVLLALVIVSFLMLIGVFFKPGEDVFLKDGWRTAFMVATLVGVILIFLNALGWLSQLVNYLRRYWHTNFIGAILLLLFLVIFLYWVTKSPPPEKKEK